MMDGLVAHSHSDKTDKVESEKGAKGLKCHCLYEANSA